MTSTALNASDLGAAHALQRLLPPLVALMLNAKQAHWNVAGPAFLPLHDFTDMLAADTTASLDARLAQSLRRAKSGTTPIA